MIESHDNLFQEFRAALEREDKPRCVSLALEALETGRIGLVSLYEHVLAPALNQATADEPDTETAVWKEHVRSAIVRTIIECCYPYLQRTLHSEGIRLDRGTAVIVAPAEEYHEIGARMGSDFFNLCGYATVFVGSNTPRETLVAGIRSVRPSCVVIHATNTYSLVEVKRVVTELRRLDATLRIFGSGYAFRHDPGLSRSLDVSLINSIADIQAFDASRALSEPSAKAEPSAPSEPPEPSEPATPSATAAGDARTGEVKS